MSSPFPFLLDVICEGLLTDVVQFQVESLESDKRQLDTRIHEFKARVSNLQQELDNSVAVQNDFVRLSQSLQMELEKIRSQATEVIHFNGD